MYVCSPKLVVALEIGGCVNIGEGQPKLATAGSDLAPNTVVIRNAYLSIAYA